MPWGKGRREERGEYEVFLQSHTFIECLLHTRPRGRHRGEQDKDPALPGAHILEGRQTVRKQTIIITHLVVGAIKKTKL